MNLSGNKASGQSNYDGCANIIFFSNFNFHQMDKLWGELWLSIDLFPINAR